MYNDSSDGQQCVKETLEVQSFKTEIVEEPMKLKMMKTEKNELPEEPVKLQIVKIEMCDIMEEPREEPTELHSSKTEMAENIKEPTKLQLTKTAEMPNKSREKYECIYSNYKKWQISKNITASSESVLLAYFRELADKYKPTTLWSIWSMIKTTLNQNEGIDINRYKQLKTFMKRESYGYKCHKPKVLSRENLEKFLKEAPDDKYLAVKVAAIFGFACSCTREELTNIRLLDVEHKEEMHVVKIPYRKSKAPNTFIIVGESSKLVQKYESLRPLNATSDRFFLNYQMGKCTNQVIGKNKFGAMPKQIAEYLNLTDPSSYTGHAFRGLSTTH